jgi:YggT family protein
MDIILVPLLLLCRSVLGLALLVVIADVVLGWLLAMNILNSKNQILYAIVSSISRISNLMLNPIRRRFTFVASGMMDFSPVILALLLTFAEHIIDRILMRFMYVS